MDAYFKFIRYSDLVNENHCAVLNDLYKGLRVAEDQGLEEVSSITLEIPHTFEEYHLQQLCPCCFHVKRNEGVIFISIDGNFSLNRFENASSDECETVNPRLFVNYGQKEYELANDTVQQKKAWDESVEKVKESRGPCAVQFFAGKSDHLSQGKAIPTKKAKRNLDETGVMVATCRHGIAVRLLNIYDSGKRQSHGISLVRSISKELDPKQINMCYDIACLFEQAIQAQVNNVTARIGQFHIYDHEGRCLTLFSLLKTKGYGLFVGEEPEQFWFQASHLVHPGKISSSARKATMLNSWAARNSKRQREMMGTTLNRKWRKLEEVCERYTRIYMDGTKFIVGRNIPTYLNEQMELQEQFYLDKE